MNEGGTSTRLGSMAKIGFGGDKLESARLSGVIAVPGVPVCENEPKKLYGEVVD